MTSAAKPRYAPDDPTLPKPWRALIDGATDFIYFWNPKTNVTTYVKPSPEPNPDEQTNAICQKKEEDGNDNAGSGDGTDKCQKREVDSNVIECSGNETASCQQQQEDCNTDVAGNENGSSSFQDQDDSTSLGTSSKVEPEYPGVHVNLNSAQETVKPPREHGKQDAGCQETAETYRRRHEITTSEVVPDPFMTFQLTGFPSEILKEAQRAGFSAPTPIQAQSWPIALKGRDIVAVAKTGSGKTLGYIIPGFSHVKRFCNNPKIGPTVLVVAPTRELATQIQDETQKFGQTSNISSVCLYGGAAKGPQLSQLYKGVDVVIATPGRLNDFLEAKQVNLEQVSYLVLDEADRMLDMGFEPQIRKIVNAIPPRRQTLMFTATWPREVRKIAADLLVKPVQVNIGNVDELVANKSITQHVEVISPIEKQRRLEQILRSQKPGSKVIIFCSTKRMCDQLARSLDRNFGAAAIHGDKNQSERDSVLAEFKSGQAPILVATDVAARGLDVKDIRAVVNYDFPTGVEDYVHRIGRTGRAGATGESYTFFCDQDSKYASDLVKILEGADQKVPSELKDMVSRGGYGGRSRRWAPTSDSHGGGGGSSYGGGGWGSSSNSDKPNNSYGGSSYGDQKPSFDRGNQGTGWSHDMATGGGRNGGSGSAGWGT